MSTAEDSRLTIALDARWIFDRMSGVGRVTENLLRNLPVVDPDNRYLYVFDDEQRMELTVRRCGLESFPNVEAVAVSYGIYSTANQLRLGRLLKRRGVDVFHSTNFMIPLRRSRAKIVVTIHDLIPLLFPDLTPRSKKRRYFGLYRRIMKRIVRIADVILADSLSTERDILRFFPAAKGKTRVVPCGIEGRYFTSSTGNGDYLRERYGTEGAIIITAGRADPYKNTLGLVKAFEILVTERKVDAHLVIVGEKDERYPEVREYVKEKGLSEHVTFTGYLDDDDLVRAYSSADLMVHPSVYEGFGFPPLEAMAVGTPVISSDAGSLPEVLGDAAVFVKPRDVEGMAQAIIDLLADNDRRKRMSEKGKEWAKRYQWKRSAEMTVRIYKETARKPR